MNKYIKNVSKTTRRQIAYHIRLNCIFSLEFIVYEESICYLQGSIPRSYKDARQELRLEGFVDRADQDDQKSLAGLVSYSRDRFGKQLNFCFEESPEDIFHHIL